MWKSKGREHQFRLPVKHGLYDHCYISNETGHMFLLDNPLAQTPTIPSHKMPR